MGLKANWWAGALAAGGLACGLGIVAGAGAVDLLACGPASAQGVTTDQAERAQMLHDALRLEPSQEAAFKAFRATMTPPPAGHGAGHRPLLATSQRTAAATRAFYAVLDPAQRRTFDALAARRS